MKIFKKTIAYMAAAALLLSGASCSDFPDKAPENTVPEESIDYTNLSNMYQPVSGVYGALRTGGMHWVGLPLYIVRDDDVWSGRHDDQGDLINIGESFVYMNSFWGFNEMWNQNYKIVRVANAALDDLANFRANCTNNDDLQKNSEYEGEVRFLRALAYYRLTQLFGDVTILRSNTQTDLTRSVRDVVYEYMLTEDLLPAIELLPKVHPRNAEHMGAATSYTAATLAAKVYLQMNDFTNVKKQTEYVINSGLFDLYPDFYNLFKTAGMLCEESLFECQLTDNGIGAGEEIKAGEWYTFQGPVNSGVVSGWGFIGYRDQFQEWAANRGETVRATTTFLKGGETTPSGDFITGTTNVTATNCWNGKAYLPVSETPAGRGYGSGNNVRILRYADVLLMHAEACANGAGTLDEAFEDFDKIRARAGFKEFLEDGKTKNPKYISKEYFKSDAERAVELILDERRMELAGEWGERYMDLVRTGKAATVLNETEVDENPGDNYIVVKGWSEDKAYYPIPPTQIENAPALANEPLTELTVQQ